MNMNLLSYILISAQHALLGEVSSHLRGVALGINYNEITIRCYFEGIILYEDKESMSSVETEILADMDENWKTKLEIVRLDPPHPLESLDAWAYLRRENYDGPKVKSINIDIPLT